ncbi:hypothetical protein FA15DRAFT_660042 [Coprinopsis marcescibilis]|uniref:Uncharacterized protein n=1 Tax=Coprinopsis marcescibilis TaxID=230819 RepID=A0A5C3KHA3_COPMA|nr:hypothetical protein FA15DRAFT_660042 [Coprinopsis marcescibilis]
MAAWYPTSEDTLHLEINCTSVPRFQTAILSFLQEMEGFQITCNSDNTSARKFAFTYPEFGKTVKAVHTLTKKKIQGNGKYQSLPPILELPNTMFMTYFMGKELCTVYPLHTLRCIGVMNFDGPVNTNSITVTQQFAEQHFLMHSGKDHSHQCGDQRRKGCRRCKAKGIPWEQAPGAMAVALWSAV